MNDQVKLNQGFPDRDRFLFIPRRQGFGCTKSLYFETLFQDPRHVEVFTYTDRLSYRRGETVRFHTSTTAPTFDIEIHRDGAQPVHVGSLRGLKGVSAPLPPNFYAEGCGWPESAAWRVPDDAPTGFYVVLSRAALPGGGVREQEHCFFVLPAQERRASLLLVAATCTWTEYNDWGGINGYLGTGGPEGFAFAPRLNLHRPWARGFVWAPEGAPRKTAWAKASRTFGAIPRYPLDEFAFAHGFSKFYASAGWAMFERPFFVWAEQAGYTVDVISQSDLQADPSILKDYRCVSLVGHDEYWTWEMREALDAYVEHGGHVARFAGNFCSQVRLEEGGRVQVCYQERAAECDPVAGTASANRLSTVWDHPSVNWPAEVSLGLSPMFGMFANVGGFTPLASRGFTVYRPEHWAFASLGVGYGDVIGDEPAVFGYEIDGLDYEFQDGLPRPSSRMRTPQGLQILAMGLASNIERATGKKGECIYYGDQAGELVQYRYGTSSPELLDAARRGSGMIVYFERGRGAMFHAGSCEWVAGLQANDRATVTVTRNVLDRFLSGR